MRVRLPGLHCPEAREPGGSAASKAMRGLTRGRHVTCSLTGERSYDRMIGTCYVGDTDLTAAITFPCQPLPWRCSRRCRTMAPRADPTLFPGNTADRPLQGIKKFWRSLTAMAGLDDDAVVAAVARLRSPAQS